MRYAFWPGCVSKGGTPELYPTATSVAEKVGMELVELDQATCTGAGALGEHDPKLVDVLNARTFALAEREGLDTLLTICSTCQGVMSAVNYRLREQPEYLAEINETLREEGLEYKGTLRVTHMMWALVEEVGIDHLKTMVSRPLRGVKIAPFYGCYILRPRYVLGMNEHPNRETYLEQLIEAVGAEPVDYEGKTKCCGFPILTTNNDTAVTMVGNHSSEAKEKGAHVMVTPCPLCHLNLDGYQPNASSKRGDNINLPVLHLPQMIGAALGFNETELHLKRHIISTNSFVEMSGIQRA
jgi:succinate dehydrogenase / fumarate reductase cytochrome b subunit